MYLGHIFNLLSLFNFTERWYAAYSVFGLHSNNVYTVSSQEKRQHFFNDEALAMSAKILSH